MSLRLGLVDAIDALALVDSRARFLAAIDGPVRKILPHDGLVCGMTDSVEEWTPHFLMLHRFPAEYMAAIQQANGSYDSEMIRRWRATRLPVIADPARREDRWWSASWMDRAMRAGITNLAGHGFVDVRHESMSYFCFIRIAEALGDKHVYVLDRLVPHLHMALVQAVGERPDARPAFPAPRAGADLSHRQLDILRWMKRGKTNAEIAIILNTTEANVKYHAKAIYRKLNAHSRTLAVTQAIALGLLD